MIIQAGIVRVVFTDTYPDPLADRYFQEAGIALTYLPKGCKK
jgi:deoxycytidylate deaminase